MGKDKDKTSKSGKPRPASMALGEDLTKHPWPEVQAIQRDRERSRESKSRSTKSSFSETNSTGHKEDFSGVTVTKSKSTKKKGGLFSKFRKSTNDKSLSEWNKNDEKLATAVDNDDVSKVVPLLSKKGVDATKLDPKGQTAFHRAAEQGKFAIVEAMLTYRADTHAQDVQARTPLHCAVRYGRTQVAERLIQENSNLAATDLKRQTVLHHATIGGSADCVRLLILYQAPLDLADKNGWTALFYAAKMGYQSICRELVQAGTNINAGDNTGRSPITFAAEHGQVQVCEFLVKKGADIRLKDNDGNDAKYWAAMGGYQEIKTFVDRAPTQAKWTTDAPDSSETDVRAEANGTAVQRISMSADETTDVTPYEEELKFDTLDLAITPLLQDKDERVNNADYSSARVNYEEYDEVDTAVVPLQEMHSIDQQLARTAVNGEDTEAHVYENIHISSTQQQSPVNHSTMHDVVSADSYQELEEEHEVLLAELQRISLENKHLNDDMKRQDSKQSEQVVNIYETQNESADESKLHIEQLQDEIEQLRERLVESDQRHEVVLNDMKVRRSVSNVNDSWVDSGDEDERVRVNEQGKQIAVLRSQVLELTQQNNHLQSQAKLADDVNHNERGGEKQSQLQTQCDDLLEYKTRMQEELSNLHNFLSSKKIPGSSIDVDTSAFEADKSSKELWVIQRDVEVICEQATLSSANHDQHDKEQQIQEMESIRQENVTLKEALVDLDAVNQQLQQERAELNEQHPQDVTQDAYRLQIQEETARLQQEKHELTRLMHDIQSALREKQQREEQERAEQERKDQERAEQERKEQERKEQERLQKVTEQQDVSRQQDMPDPAGPLAALTMEAISLNVSEVVMDTPEDSTDTTLQKQSVEQQLSEQKLMLESVLKQVKAEKNKLASIEHKLVDSKDTLKTMNLQIEDLDEDVKHKQKENHELDEVLAERQTENSELVKVIAVHQRELQDFENAKSEKKVEIAKIDSLLESKQSEVNLVVTMLEVKTEAQTKLESSTLSERQTLREIHEDVSKQNEKLSQLVENYQHKMKEVNKLESLSKDLADEISEAKDEKQKVLKEKDSILLEKQTVIVEHEQIKTQLQTDKLTLEHLEHSIAKQQPGENGLDDVIQIEQIEPIKAVVTNTLRAAPSEPEDDKRLQLMIEQEKEIKELQDINQALADQIEELRQTSTPTPSTGSNVEKLKDENDRLRDENEFLLANQPDNEESNVQQECEILKKENSRLYDDIKALRTLIEKTSGEEVVAGELTYLRGQNETLSSERQQLEVNNTELHSLMDALQHTLQEREQQERAELKRAVFDAMDRQRAAESDTDSEILDYKVELDDLKALNADQHSEMETLRQDKHELEAALAQLQDASEGMMQDHNTGAEEYEINLTKATHDNDKLSTQLKLLNTENETLKNSVEKLEKTTKSTHKPTDGDLLEKYHKAQDDIENLKEQLEQTQEESEQFVSSIKELEDHLLDQQKQSDTIKELNEDNDILVTEIKDLQKDIQDLTSARTKVDEENIELNDRLEQTEKDRKDLELENKILLREQLKRNVEISAEISKDVSSENVSSTEAKPFEVDKIELKALEKTISELKQRNDDLGVDINKIKEELTCERESKRNTEKTLAETSQEVLNQRDQNMELASQLEEFAGKLESIGADHEAEIQDEQDRAQQEIERLLDVSKDLSKELEQYKDLIEDLKDDNDAKVQDLMEEQDFLLEKIKALEVTKAAKEKTFENEDINENDEIIQDLETQVEEFKEKLDNDKKQIEILQRENAEYKAEAMSEEEKAAAKAAQTALEQLREDNKLLLVQVETLKDELAIKKSPSPVPSPTPDKNNKTNKEENEQMRELQKAVITLQHQLQEVDTRHKDVVNTYRTHLLAAAEGRMDSEVRDALMHIVKLRAPEDTMSSTF